MAHFGALRHIGGAHLAGAHLAGRHLGGAHLGGHHLAGAHMHMAGAHAAGAHRHLAGTHAAGAHHHLAGAHAAGAHHHLAGAQANQCTPAASAPTTPAVIPPPLGIPTGQGFLPSLFRTSRNNHPDIGDLPGIRDDSPLSLPQAQWSHCSAIVESKLYTYGGHYGQRGTPLNPPIAIKAFDLETQVWELVPTTGQPHPGFIGAACATVDTRLYYFGGHNTESFSNSIHCLETKTFTWSEVKPHNPSEAPRAKGDAAMITYMGTLLVTYGGYGELPPTPTPEGTSSKKWGWSNHLHYFDTKNKTWSSAYSSGSPPPACVGCSLTRVDEHRAVLFGGLQEKCVPNHIYILDLQFFPMLIWSRVVADPMQPWPVGRAWHSAISLHDPDSHPTEPVLMMMGGGSEGGSVIHSDAWTFHVDTKKWHRVLLCNLIGRSSHTTSIVHCSSTIKQLVTCGGLYEWPKNGDLNSVVPVAETTIIEMEFIASRDWVVTDIIYTEQQKQPKGVSMAKLTPDTPLNMRDLRCLRSVTVNIRPLDIISIVAPNWPEFATCLQMNVDQIVSAYPDNPEAICITMFLLWLNGGSPKPATWGSLIECLRATSMQQIASEIAVILDTQSGIGFPTTKAISYQNDMKQQSPPSEPPSPNFLLEQLHKQWGHCSVIVGSKFYAYGGLNQQTGTPASPPTVVKEFDLESQVWEQKFTTGDPPPGFVGVACASLNTHLYCFSGHNTKKLSNSVHCLEIQTLTWNELKPHNPGNAPRPRCSAAMISYMGKRLVTYGGYGELPLNTTLHQSEEKYVPNPKSENKCGWSGELHYFDIDRRTWHSPQITGSPPPACSGCSLTRVDEHRAVLFGGVQLEKSVPNDIYILDLTELLSQATWIRVVAGPGQPWPVGRAWHSAVSLHDPDSHPTEPVLMMMWGQSLHTGVVLSHAWTFNVNAQQWHLMFLGVKGRTQHTTSIVHCDSTHKQLVAYGGFCYYHKEGDPSNAAPVAETTIIELEYMMSKDWVVTDIFPSRKLGQPKEVVMPKLTLDTPLSMKCLRCLRTGADCQPLDIISIVAPNWPEFASCLQMNVDQIVSTYPDNPEASCIAMFLLWLNSESLKPATWGSLIECLDKLSWHQVAREIELKLHSQSEVTTQLALRSPASEAKQESKKHKEGLDAHQEELHSHKELDSHEQDAHQEELDSHKELDSHEQDTHQEELDSHKELDSHERDTYQGLLTQRNERIKLLWKQLVHKEQQYEEACQRMQQMLTERETFAQTLREKEHQVSSLQLTIDNQERDLSGKEEALVGKELQISAQKLVVDQLHRHFQQEQALRAETEEERQKLMLSLRVSKENLVQLQGALTRSKQEIATLNHTISLQQDKVKMKERELHALRQAAEGKPQGEETPEGGMEEESYQFTATESNQQEASSLSEPVPRSDEITSLQLPNLEELYSPLESRDSDLQSMRDEMERSIQGMTVLGHRIEISHQETDQQESESTVQLPQELALTKIRLQETEGELLLEKMEAECHQHDLQILRQKEKEMQEQLKQAEKELEVHMQKEREKEILMQEQPGQTQGIQEEILTQEQPRQTGQLRGVQVVGETTFTATRDAPTTLNWEEYGFKLHIPDGALPVEQCHIHVKATIRGQFQLPDDHELVSAVFWIWCPYKLSKPATMEIEHCAAVVTQNQCSALTFVRSHCTQKDLPYIFKPVRGGTFTPSSSYGSILRTHFSAYGISKPRKRRKKQPSRAVLMKHPLQRQRWKIDKPATAVMIKNKHPSHTEVVEPMFPNSVPESEEPTHTQIVQNHTSPESGFTSQIHMETTPQSPETDDESLLIYCAQLYCASKGQNAWALHFVLFKDLNAEMKVVTEHYSKKPHFNLEIEYMKLKLEEDEITLDIPKEGIELDGWRITPRYSPTITQESISRFVGGSGTLPACELLAECYEQKKPHSLKHYINVLGACAPKNYFLLTLNPILETAQQPVQLPPHGKPPIFEQRPSVRNLSLLIYEENGQRKKLSIVDSIAAAPSGWQNLARKGLEMPGISIVVGIIAAANPTDTRKCTTDLLDMWRQSGDNPTWNVLIKALYDAGFVVLAKDVHHILPIATNIRED